MAEPTPPPDVPEFGKIEPKKGMEENVREELFKLVAPTRSEPGCIVYDLYQSADDKQAFMFYEFWRNKGDLDAHLQKPYIKSFMKKAGEMLTEPVGVFLWSKISVD